MTKGFVRKALVLFAVATAGFAVLGVGGNNHTTIIVGSVLEGVAGIFLISLIFYEVGKSEDREREGR